jgi:hypothetical protein
MDKQEELLTKWLEVQDEPDDLFLEKLKNYTLDTWDHRTHLRIAWLYLTREGRRNGMKLIFDGIKNFIANSPRTNGKTFHETMTYFWYDVLLLVNNFVGYIWYIMRWKQQKIHWETSRDFY